MSFEPVLNASLAIRVHMATVIPAFFLGTWLMFLSKKGSWSHRLVGAIYLLLMTVTATAGIFIREVHPGHFSWLHIFVIITYFCVFSAIWSLRHNNIRGHQAAMWGLYFGGLIIAGALTFLSGRIMHRIFLG